MIEPWMNQMCRHDVFLKACSQCLLERLEEAVNLLHEDAYALHTRQHVNEWARKRDAFVKQYKTPIKDCIEKKAVLGVNVTARCTCKDDTFYYGHRSDCELEKERERKKLLNDLTSDFELESDPNVPTEATWETWTPPEGWEVVERSKDVIKVRPISPKGTAIVITEASMQKVVESMENPKPTQALQDLMKKTRPCLCRTSRDFDGRFCVVHDKDCDLYGKAGR